MRSLVFGMVVASMFGCEKTKEMEPRYEGPMPVAFGDCAGPTVSWVSGPRPQPFTAAQADAVAVATTASTAPALDDGKPKQDSDAPSAGVLGSTALGQGGAFASITATGDISSGFDDTNIYGGLIGNEAVGDMNGGYGLGHVGGGGGSGWGTIGIGRYGTIGHGSGTGVGYGGGSHIRSAAVPTVSVGQPNAKGALDKAVIRRYIKRNIQKLQYCYEKQLLAKPTLAGTVTAQFFIGPNGEVSTSTANGVDPEVADCVSQVIRTIEFPKPQDGNGVLVNYPFTFRPAGDGGSSPPRRAPHAGNAATTPAPGSGSAAGSAAAGSPAAGSAAAPEPPPAAPPAPPATPATRRLFRSDPSDTPKYQPGAANPFRAEQAALIECFRKNPKHYGAIVVELGGATTLVHGLDDGIARACVLEVAKRVKPATAQRCSIAFGEMPATEAPSVEITADSIKLAGKPLATPEAIIHDDTATWTIPEVVTAIQARVDAQTASKAPINSIFGPLLVRPLESTPMKVVYRVVHSVLAGGDDPVLARHRGNEWQPLPQLALPVVPVPLGTGGKWNHLKHSGHSAGPAGDERIVLSILIEKDKLWVGLSRVNEFQELPRDATQPQKLIDALKEHKASAFFADRADVEVGADDDVTYSDVVAAIDAATQAGFTDWLLTDPQALSARPAL